VWNLAATAERDKFQGGLGHSSTPLRAWILSDCGLAEVVDAAGPGEFVDVVGDAPQDGHDAGQIRGDLEPPGPIRGIGNKRPTNTARVSSFLNTLVAGVCLVMDMAVWRRKRWVLARVTAWGFWTLVRGYWTFVLLSIAAIVLLLLGAPTKAALAGAGFAFIGAAVTRLIDIAGERKAAASRANDARLTDLDETRRLAYAALLTRASGARAVFDATLVNALAHHGLGVDPDEAAGHLQSLDRDESRRWLEEQIGRMTAERTRISPRTRE
jgi:hypothetical protein